MASEGFEVEEWDADFLDQLVQAEELALSTSATQPPPPQFLHYRPPPLHPARPYGDISYSPPRELSQRVHDTLAAVVDHGHSDIVKEREIDSLKRELGRVSNQLKVLEEECIMLKKERDKKEEQLKFISSRVETTAAEDCHANSISLREDNGVLQECRKNNSSSESFAFRVKQPSKAVGVQTDNAAASDDSSIKNDLFVTYQNHKKLLDVWDLLDVHKLRKDLVLKLFETCGLDFQVLFGYLNLPSSTKMDTPMRKSVVPLRDPLQPTGSSDAAEISHLYLTLTKISNGMVELEDLLEALVDCCRMKNGVIVYRSLRVLHVVIKHASSLRKKFGRRDNIMVEGTLSGHTLADICEQQSVDCRYLPYPHAKNVLNEWDSQLGEKWFSAKRKSCIPHPSKFDWSSVFELMSQITLTNHEEHVRIEAVSIMNMILISCNAYSEREKFGSELVFRSISQLLKKEAGYCVRKQAVNLLYRLFNCPKVTATFFGCTEDAEAPVSTEIGAKISTSFQEFSAIMNGLAECVACTENSRKELMLRRSAITVLAFVASLGKAGLGIMLNHRLPKKTNILASILESLILDVDLEALDSAQSFEVFRERTLLIREVLILLNRLVSHPQFSTAVLQALTTRRDVASLTIDAAKRLCRKGKFLWQDDRMTKQIRESEIVELAWVFRRRVFAFLGDATS